MAWHGMAWHGIAWCSIAYIAMLCYAMPEARWRELPRLLEEAMPRHEQLLAALEARRKLFLYEMPSHGHRAGAALCGIFADAANRFAPHLHAWRGGDSPPPPPLPPPPPPAASPPPSR